MRAMTVERDGRTHAVENAGYRWSYLVLSFGLLGIVAYRSYSPGESSWDLLALVVGGGVVNAAYQGMNGVLYRRWYVLTVVTMLLAAILAALLVAARG